MNALLVEHALELGDVARLLGTTLVAVQSWRRWEPIPAGYHAKLQDALRLMQLLHMRCLTGRWLVHPILEGLRITPADVFASAGVAPVLDLADHRRNVVAVLDDFVPGWTTLARAVAAHS